MRKSKEIAIIAFVLYSLINIGTVCAEIPLFDEPLMDEFQMPGIIEGIGTYFEINNSEYLNITLDSIEPIKIVLESMPEMVTMHIETDSGAVSTVITLGGFLPLTTYHMYEDNYHNHIAFTTDEYGKYTYTQDISVPHFVFIQPRPSTKFIRDDDTGGDCAPTVNPIGTWNSATKTCTLTIDLFETIQIDSNGITLDGNGHTITGSYAGYGIFLTGKMGVIVQNINVRQFSNGIYLHSSSNNKLINNTARSNSGDGITLYLSSYNTLRGNNADLNNHYGIWVRTSNNNTLRGNNVSSNMYYGILLATSSNDNTIIGNIASESSAAGISLHYSCNNNTLSNNTVFDHHSRGIDILISSNNTIIGNTALNNYYGITISSRSNNNTLSNNTAFQNRGMGIVLGFSSNNILSNNTALNNNLGGIYVHNCNNHNTLSNNTALNNNYGIYLNQANNITLKGNTALNNNYGIYLSFSSNNNLIYNNNFINNPTQAYVSPDSSGNLFNLAAPIGGNYWSDWISPDVDNDGFVDDPYVFTLGQDNLPWAEPNGWLVGINQPPVVGPITAPIDPVAVGTSITATADFTDPDVEDTHKATWGWDDNTTSVGTVTESGGSGTISDSHVYTTPGTYKITLTVTDNDGGIGTAVASQFIVVYDPDGGFVTGGGWINSPEGAYRDDPTLSGHATFGFHSKYMKGAIVPTGKTEFHFGIANQFADLKFHSDDYQWLVISGAKAKYKGTGTINDIGNYGFILTAIDGDIKGYEDGDMFRIKIWDLDNEDAIIYDNEFGKEDDADATTIVQEGSIIIHKE